jgi:hypothetical protein
MQGAVYGVSGFILIICLGIWAYQAYLQKIHNKENNDEEDN